MPFLSKAQSTRDSRLYKVDSKMQEFIDSLTIEDEKLNYVMTDAQKKRVKLELEQMETDSLQIVASVLIYRAYFFQHTQFMALRGTIERATFTYFLREMEESLNSKMKRILRKKQYDVFQDLTPSRRFYKSKKNMKRVQKKRSRRK